MEGKGECSVVFNKEEQRKPPTLVLLKKNYQHFSANVSTNFASQNATTFQHQRCLFHNQHFLWGWSKCCCCWLLALCSATCKCISLDNWTCCHTETWMHGPQGQQVGQDVKQPTHNNITNVSPGTWEFLALESAGLGGGAFELLAARTLPVLLPDVVRRRRRWPVLLVELVEVVR